MNLHRKNVDQGHNHHKKCRPLKQNSELRPLCSPTAEDINENRLCMSSDIRSEKMLRVMLRPDASTCVGLALSCRLAAQRRTVESQQKI